MTEKEFLRATWRDDGDVLQTFLDLLEGSKLAYWVIGGLAVNAYAEPVVSLDLVVVLAAQDIDRFCQALKPYFGIERFAHSVNLTSQKSDLRIQLQTDARYQDFIAHAAPRKVLGYTMNVARVEDVLQGKIWAFLDETRRASKRQKDLADIARLVETHPELAFTLPESVRARIV